MTYKIKQKKLKEKIIANYGLYTPEKFIVKRGNKFFLRKENMFFFKKDTPLSKQEALKLKREFDKSPKEYGGRQEFGDRE